MLGYLDGDLPMKTSWKTLSRFVRSSETGTQKQGITCTERCFAFHGNLLYCLDRYGIEAGKIVGDIVSGP